MKSLEVSTEAGRHRVLPTHELNARRRRKQVVPPQTSTSQPEGYRNTEAREAETASIAHLYSQFPPQGPLA